MRLVLVFAAGCAYKAGSYAYMSNAFPGQRATVGCLDLAVSRLPDSYDGAVMQFQFGNRCDHEAAVSLPTVARGRLFDGSEQTLSVYDPNAEVDPKKLDGRSFGSETLEYRAESGDRIAEICIDAGKIAGDAEGAHLLCFGGSPSATAPGSAAR